MILMLFGAIRTVALICFRKYILKEGVLGESWYETFFVIGIYLCTFYMTIIINMYMMLGVWDINRINYCLN